MINFANSSPVLIYIGEIFITLIFYPVLKIARRIWQPFIILTLTKNVPAIQNVIKV